MREGKIIKALSGFYYVFHEHKIIQCRGRGVFRKQKISPLVGDKVYFQAENDTEGYIMKVEKRKNELIRPPIANIDQAILVFSAKEPDFSSQLLDRFLVMIESNHIDPIICITKMDLLTNEEIIKVNKEIETYRAIGYMVYVLSPSDETSMALLRKSFANKISVFAGQTGVGKSSLLNKLRPDLDLKTAEISLSLGRGKHTTRHVELIEIGEGLVADTPGFSSLEFTNIEAEDLGLSFPEFLRYTEDCKFRGCLHSNEPHCGVKKAVEDEKISATRYQHYIQFLQEIKDRKPRYSK